MVNTPKHFTGMTDAYAESLDQMIRMFQNYKPGSVTLDNITKLCHTLGLESFIDNIENDISRLSIASKIIVIDIDYHRIQRKVIDVKLVLASNFDNFNYYNDGEANTNILYNSLNGASDLHIFHHNLEFLCLLDSFSHIETEPDSSSGGKFDLFRYYTELSAYLSRHVSNSGLNFEIKGNVANQFGISIILKNEIIAKIIFEESDDSAHRLYEYIYSEESGWFNENAECYTTGVSLVFQVMSPKVYFLHDFIPSEIMLDPNPEGSYEIVNRHPKIELLNDFTTSLVHFHKFDLSNDNLELLSDILKWVCWWTDILCPILDGLKVAHPVNPTISASRRRTSSTTSSVTAATRRSSFTKRRRSSAKGRKPSMSESTMLKDEGLQQFTLHEIMNQPVIDEADDEDGSNQESLELVVNEDYLFLEDIGGCGFHNDPKEWVGFLDKFRDKYM